MAQAEIGALRVRLAMDAGQFSSGSKRAGQSMDRLADKAKRVGAAIGAAFAVDRLTSFARNAVKAFGVQEDAIAAIEAGIKSTGGTAGLTSKQLQQMASELQNVSTFGDEEILKKVTANFLTFGNIVGPVFKRAQEAALDLSQVLGQDLQSSTIQLGKALNDPITGITALSRVGIAFTEQQKEQIKTLVKSGKVMEAQGVILDEIEKFYGAAAEAAAKTTQGQLTQAANAFGDAMESIGSVIAPVVVPAANAVKLLAERFQQLSPEAQRFIVVAAGSTAVIGTAAAVVGVFVAALGALAAPLAAVAAGIGVLSGAVAAFWPNLKQLAQFAATAFQDIFESAKRWLIDALEPVIRRVNAFVDRIRDAFASLREALGLDTVAAAVASTVDAVVEKAQLGVDKLRAVWTVAAEEMEAEAPAISAQMAAAMVQANAKAQAASAGMQQAAKDAQAAQQKLVDEGVRLSEGTQTPFEAMEQRSKSLTAALEANKISASTFGAAMVQSSAVAQNAYAGMASSIAGSLEQVFGQSKAVAIATALINTYEAFTKALSAYPPPFNYAAAAATLAAGLAQVANIRKTTKNSSGGGAASGAAGQAAGGGQAAQAGAQQSLTVQGIRADQIFTGDVVRGLAEQLLDFQRDGGRVILA